MMNFFFGDFRALHDGSALTIDSYFFDKAVSCINSIIDSACISYLRKNYHPSSDFELFLDPDIYDLSSALHNMITESGLCGDIKKTASSLLPFDDTRTIKEITREFSFLVRSFIKNGVKKDPRGIPIFPSTYFIDFKEVEENEASAVLSVHK